MLIFHTNDLRQNPHTKPNDSQEDRNDDEDDADTSAAMGSDNRPVCYRCAQIKQACDGNLPCARCVRLSLPCWPRDSSGAAGAAGNGEFFGELPKARIRRVQTGCAMCKRRKKKCDEVKPRCGDCRRLCLDCMWPPERAKDSKATPAPAVTKQEPHSSPISNSTVVVNGDTIDIAIRSSQSPKLSSPGNSNPPNTSHTSNADSADNHWPTIYQAGTVEAAPVYPMHPPEADIMFDPSTWNMSTSPQAWYNQYTPVSDGSARPSLDPAGAATLSLYIPQLLPQLETPFDRALLNHYSTIVASILSRRASPNNPYNHYLLPMAQSNNLVLHCILALSANHWRKMQPDLGDRGLYHQGKAANALAAMLSHVDRTSADIALVSCLLLCMTELFDGASERWKLHLKGARRLLHALMTQQGKFMTGHYKFLLRLARFLDSAATTSTCRPPLIGDEEAEAETLTRLTVSLDEEDSAVYGIPKDLFHLLDRVNTLADKRKTRVDRASELAFRREVAELDASIDEWSYERGGSSHAAWMLTPLDDDVIYAAAAFENALRLRVHQIVEGYDLDEPIVTRSVNNILDSVQKIRYGSPLESNVLFPLVMAGGACSTMEQRLIIQDRLLVMERTCGFGYVFNARFLVERVWDRRDRPDGSGEDVNWAKIRYEEMHGLVVF